MTDIENENLLLEALAKGCNLFVGAGFSVLSKDRAGQALPVGSDLKRELLEHFNRRELAALDLAKIIAILKSVAGSDLRAYLTARFSVGSYAPAYSELLKIKAENIFSTNIDDLLYQLFEHSDHSYLNDVYLMGPSFAVTSAINYIPLHGSTRDPTRDYVFSTTEIASAFANDPDRWHFVRERLTSRSTIFLGYSLEDAGILQTLSPLLSVPGATPKPNWVIVHPSANESVPYFHAIGLSVASGDTASFLAYIGRRIPPKSRSIVEKGTRPDFTSFKDLLIPKIGQVVSRPIREFFAGSPPSWGDIYSGQIPLLSTYTKLLNALAGSKHPLLIGAVASGKTTLAMQCAAHSHFEGEKLFADATSLSPERAKLLAAVVNGYPTMLFIDNYTEALGSVEFLSKLPNFKMVCLDRAYNYEFTSHFLNAKRWDLIDATALTEADVEQVVRALPSDIRNANPTPPAMEGGLSPSVFEVVESNVIFPKLRDRYVKVLREMDRDHQVAHDFLVMCCYVHRCRVPISYDMAYAFMRNYISDFSHLNKIVAELGVLITDYKGELVLEEQDYFVPRSALLSDAILWQTSPTALHRVIKRFHDEVSPERIYRRDIFKRWAYDKDIIVRAFPDWEDGVAFYDRAMDHDPSPYLKQQAALYCLKLARFKEAFVYADRALTQSGGRKFSIRNTFAVVQFASNIEVPDGEKATSDVRKYLDSSMDMLGECYAADQRKIYHALEYGKQAIQYWQRYQDEKAAGYLTRALGWVTEELKNNTWNRTLFYLSRNIKGFLKL